MIYLFQSSAYECNYHTKTMARLLKQKAFPSSCKGEYNIYIHSDDVIQKYITGF